MNVMQRLRKLFSKQLPSYKTNVTYNFNDALPGHPDNTYISEKLFESDSLVFDLGFVPDYKMYNVMVIPYKQKKDV